MLVPPWLEPLLSTTFFSICQAHISLPRNECNMFCIDCNHRAFCFYCKSIWHQRHQVIQIRRSSYHDVVRLSEIEKVLDVSGVQTYVINSARVIFLNERPQPKTNATNSCGKSNSHFCGICRRSLLDPFCFCSLGCKLVDIKKNSERESLALSAKKDEEMGTRRGMARRLRSREEKEEWHEGIHKQEYQGMHHAPSPRLPLQRAYSNSKRRKGIPHRAPLGP